jgi:hypothetical protein
MESQMLRGMKLMVEIKGEEVMKRPESSLLSEGVLERQRSREECEMLIAIEWIWSVYYDITFDTVV